MTYSIVLVFFSKLVKKKYAKAYVALYSHSLQRGVKGDIHCLINGFEDMVDMVCPFNGLVSSHEKRKCWHMLQQCES